MKTQPLVPECHAGAGLSRRAQAAKTGKVSIGGPARRAAPAVRAKPALLVEEDTITYPIYATRTLKKDQRCPLCTGRGRVICKVCQGAGKMQDRDVECEWCEGRGTEKCSRCNGCGFVFSEGT